MKSFNKRDSSDLYEISPQYNGLDKNPKKEFDANNELGAITQDQKDRNYFIRIYRDQGLSMAEIEANLESMGLSETQIKASHQTEQNYDNAIEVPEGELESFKSPSNHNESLVTWGQVKQDIDKDNIEIDDNQPSKSYDWGHDPL